MAAPIALTAGSASAATTTSTDPACVPVTEKAAVAEVDHIEYKYKPAVGTGHIKWSTEDVPTKDFGGVAYVRDGVKTQIVIDSPAVAAVDGVNCQIPFPANPLTGLNGISPNMTVPTPAGTEKYTFSPVVNHIALNGKIGTTVTTKPGYVFPGGLTSKVFAATPDNTGYVFYSQIVGHHINLPDVFNIDQTASGRAGYWSTKVSLTIVNDTNTDQEFRIRYADQQDGNRVWVQGSRFTDGLPNNVVPANSSRPFEIDVWHDVVTSGADVPDDLTLDFGFELA